MTIPDSFRKMWPFKFASWTEQLFQGWILSLVFGSWSRIANVSQKLRKPQNHRFPRHRVFHLFPHKGFFATCSKVSPTPINWGVGLKTVSLSSISLRSELQASSWWGAELWAWVTSFRNRHIQVWQICRLFVDDMIWRVYAFLSCKLRKWQCAGISLPGCKDRLPHWHKNFSPDLKVLQTVMHDVIHDYF